ncbi:MAG: NAD(P)-dependent oxidoreductase [Oscillospiraceae bacterium]|nr:NAD(P)-dependent oxidoreductase [Oscillospiraceae bacterium]
MKFLVTGSSGGFGKWIIKELQENGHTAVGVDLCPPSELLCPFLAADLKNSGEVFSVMSEEKPDAVINLAAIPRPRITSARHTFLTNFEIAYNVFEAAATLGIKKIIHASTDSSYGFVFAKHTVMPRYLPVDEAHPQMPQDCYGGSKLLNEQTAKIFTGANPDMQITCLRICWLIEPENLSRFSERGDDFENIRGEYRGLFSYIDMRDAAAAFRLAAEKDIPGFEAFNITAEDTTAGIKTKELIAQCFPDTELRKEFTGNESLFSIEKAARMLGWRQKYTWRKDKNN